MTTEEQDILDGIAYLAYEKLGQRVIMALKVSKNTMICIEMIEKESLKNGKIKI